MNFTYEWLRMVVTTIDTIYQEELQRKPDPDGLAAYLHAAMYGGMTGEQIREIIKNSDEYKQLHAQPPTPSSDPVGRISRAGDVFQVNGKIFRPVFASGFALSTRPEGEQDAFIDWLSQKGFNGVRVMVGGLSWAGQTPETARNGLEKLLHKLRAKNLYASLTLLTDTAVIKTDKQEHVKKVREIVEKFDNTIIEMANEPYHATQDDEVHSLEYLYNLSKLFSQVQVVSLGAIESDEQKPAHYRDFITAHLDRSRSPWPNQIRRVRELELVKNETKVPLLNNEPIGAGEVDINGKRISDSEAFFTMGVLNRIFEVGGVFHFEDGLLAKVPRPVQNYCAERFVQGSKLGYELGRLTFKNTGWHDSPVKSADFNSVTRVYSGVSGDRGMLVIVGGTFPKAKVEFQNGWRLDKPMFIGNQVDVVQIVRG